MPTFLLVGDFVDVDVDAAFLHFAKLVVDGCAEKAHGGGEVHIGVDQRRNVDAVAAYELIEAAVVFLKVVAHEKMLGARCRRVGLERLNRGDQCLAVGEVETQEVEQQVAALSLVRGIHRHLAQQIFGVGVEHGECAQAVPEVVERENRLRTLVG